ncbi:MAG: hypothetical protein VYE27_08800 [Pseudomonadota bacterium]|nr:hypothetical protein [Pseudomonadota bacterium]
MIKVGTNAAATCHCGSIQLNIFLPKRLDRIIRCTCSMCSKAKGVGMLCVPIKDVSVSDSSNSMKKYFFNKTHSPHFFCDVCGIHTHHKSRATPNKFCINVSCINGFEFKNFKNKIIEFDGKNHPKDQK